MSDALHIPARPDAPVACDMRAAVDTPAERLRAYARLFDAAFVARERRPDAVVLRFRADADVRARVEEMVRRESACCPFVDYRVEAAGGEVIWTTTDTAAGRAGVDAILDALYELPEHAGSGAIGLFDRLAARGVAVPASGR